MKTFKFFMVIVLSAAMLIISKQAFAQRQGQGMNKGMQNCYLQNSIPDLTQEQQKKIIELRTAHMKEMMLFRNQMQEKRAHLNTLRTADKPNMNEIDKTIDEMGELKTKMMKQRERFFQSIRKELTDDQRVYFDTRGHGKGMGQGYGKGYGKHCKGAGAR